MTIALLGISSIYNGFQKFWGASATVPNLAKTNGHQTKQRALRVLRISEQGDASSCAGRMVISGRMADVCAELDRLVALEALNKPSLPH
jgi:hypothetical protein